MQRWRASPGFLKLGGASGLWMRDNSPVTKAYRDAEEFLRRRQSVAAICSHMKWSKVARWWPAFDGEQVTSDAARCPRTGDAAAVADHPSDMHVACCAPAGGHDYAASPGSVPLSARSVSSATSAR
jgi:hypothetical protein